MAIAYKSQGAGVATEASGGALSPLCPAVVAANDILIAHCAYEGTTTTPDTPSGWTLLGGPYEIEGAYRHWIFGKIAAGTEDGAAVPFGTPAVTTVRWARVYSFDGWVSGTITQVVPAASFAHLSHATDPQMPTVTTTVAGALAVACVAQADDNAMASATGESGGDWVEAVAEYVQSATTPDTGMGIQTCTPTGDPGTVTGGSISTVNDPCGVIGFEIRPSVVTVTGTGALTAQAASADGEGVSLSTGTGTPTAQAATVEGDGVSSSTGTGTPTAQASTVAGSGVSSSTGEGELVADASTVAGSGLAAWVGSGDLEAQASTVAGSGVSGSTGAGTPAAQSATVAGSGASASTGSGTPTAQAATASGAGVSGSTGAGTPAAQASTASGSGVSGSSGAGTPTAQAATANGAGASGSTGAGALAASGSSASGSGSVAVEGDPDLCHFDSAVTSWDSTQRRFDATTCTPPAVVPDLCHFDSTVTTWDSTERTLDATTCDDAVSGTGALACGAASLAGAGAVTNPGHEHVGPPPTSRVIPFPIEGRGALKAQPATVQGSGDVSWDDYNRIFMLLAEAA